MSGITGVSPLSVNPVQLGGSQSPSPAGGGFGALLANAVQQLSQSQSAANQAVAQAMTGQGSVTQVMVALTEAQMSLNVGVGIRNGVVEAYQSIMNMPLS